MSKRTVKEINEIGFRALVDALGKEDASRFIAQFTATRPTGASEPTTESEPLPVMNPVEAHEYIRDLQDPIDQAHLL